MKRIITRSTVLMLLGVLISTLAFNLSIDRPKGPMDLVHYHGGDGADPLIGVQMPDGFIPIVQRPHLNHIPAPFTITVLESNLW